MVMLTFGRPNVDDSGDDNNNNNNNNNSRHETSLRLPVGPGAPSQGDSHKTSLRLPIVGPGAPS